MQQKNVQPHLIKVCLKNLSADMLPFYYGRLGPLQLLSNVRSMWAAYGFFSTGYRNAFPGLCHRAEQR